MMHSMDGLDAFPSKPPRGLTEAEFNWYFVEKLSHGELSPKMAIAELWILYETIDKRTPKGKFLCQCIKSDFAQCQKDIQDLQKPPILDRFKSQSHPPTANTEMYPRRTQSKTPKNR